ncbi:putative short-chain dehydrogenase reductase SDR [Rosellinia necatrix]|uniref:Putative short-chain dehydrogenase reductase SDR n=1 Tax=Rosellinia necatrix TaxID=77044 RepID=A0A1S7UMJ3_ROSNE|nr:putative short-chain dehydrogenase reductase SDR [Rosellinia necatrix]
MAALQAGHKVVGATRDVSRAERTCPDFLARGGVWVQLDPGQKDSPDQFANVSREYDIDVLVNCAGYAMVGGIEDTSEEEVRAQMEVNFYGPLRAVRACLPVMRAKGFGHVILISSGAGFIARAGRGVYSASKFAIEAIHESLTQEVQTLGIKVLIVEPGAFRTPFATRLLTPAAHESTEGVSEPYKGTALDQVVSLSRGFTDVPPPHLVRGCPDKAGREIVKAVGDGHSYLRMLLGPDCVAAMNLKLESLHHDLEATKAIAMSTDIDHDESKA